MIYLLLWAQLVEDYTMKSYIEISKSALIDNITTIRNYIHPNTKIMSVVKANAYGHGLHQVVPVLESKTDMYAVYHIETAITLNYMTPKPILILGSICNQDECDVAVNEGFHISIYTLKQLEMVIQSSKKIGKTAYIHLNVNTGLNREGLAWYQFGMEDRKPFNTVFHKAMDNREHIRIAGLYSHFANIEDTMNPAKAKEQIKRFQQFIDYTKIFIIEPKPILTHMSATSGLMLYDKATGKYDIVRPGLGLYGMYPSEYLKINFSQNGFKLKPVLTWKTSVRQVQTIEAGEAVSYGCTWKATQRTKIATIPIGYSDGLSRKFSNIGEVLIHGFRCPILGRQAMNLHVVDVSRISDVQEGDEVVILGKQFKEEITAEELADKFGTINYEITTAISPILKRTLVE